MAKEIVKEDIPKIQQLLRKVLLTDDYISMERMGGLTNHTYKVTMPNQKEFVVRIPGEGTEQMINRKDEMISTKLACELGVDAEMLYFGEDGSKVTCFIPDAITMSKETIKDEENIHWIAKIFRTLHTCDVNTGVPFDVFTMAKSYEDIINEHHVVMFNDYQQMKEAVMKIKEEIDSLFHIKKVPCHNDPLCENWVLGKDRMYLIDWEYAGMNDGMWDLADVSIEAEFDDEKDKKLLEAYLQQEPTIMDKKHFLANKIYVDYLWSLWAKTRVPYDGQSMEDWAVERYNRLKSFVKKYQSL